MAALNSFMARFALNLPRYARIRSRFQKYTMIPWSSYVRNLALVHRFSYVEGCVVECGVWRGGMSAGIANILGPHRHYHLFDSFEGLPPAKEIDGRKAVEWQADKAGEGYYNNCRAEQQEAASAMDRSKAQQYTLHKGWFEQTIPPWAKTAPGIAVLRLDCDWYESMKICLSELMPLVVPGGIVIVDDYYAWDGCARAVHEYLSGSSKPLRMRQYLNGPFYLVNE